MEKVRILEVKQSVFANNDAQAEKLREELKQKGIYLLNLMSSPGSGKTTTLTRLIELLKEDLKIGVMEADIDSDVDAVTIAATGAKAIQLHTGGMCHLDAAMTRQGHDKPLKYPLMFQVCDAVLINKIDVAPYFDFDFEKCTEYIRMRNPKAVIFPISAKTGEGIEAVADWLKEEVKNWKGA